MDGAQFYGVRAAAANLSQDSSAYTGEMFLTDFPQFSDGNGDPIAPRSVMDLFISQACAAISPDKWFEKWRYACGLHVAHNLTLYLRTYAPGSESAAQAAASGATVGIVKSAKLGDAEVSYDTSAMTAGTEKWGGLNATQYGQNLATLARLIGAGGMTVI